MDKNEAKEYMTKTVGPQDSFVVNQVSNLAVLIERAASAALFLYVSTKWRKIGMLKRSATILMICFSTMWVFAQDYMRIHYKSGAHIDIAIAEIDSVTFVDKDDYNYENDNVDGEATLLGSWLWGDVDAGYYELLTFKDDHTYTGYDNYFTYGFDTQTYGWYSHYGAILTLQSNGFGYKRRYNWYVTALTGNALEVMTRMGSFTYYKLQGDTLRFQKGSYLTCGDDESYVFADGVIARIEENRLVGLSPGTTYILKNVANSIYAYCVIIE